MKYFLCSRIADLAILSGNPDYNIIQQKNLRNLCLNKKKRKVCATAKEDKNKTDFEFSSSKNN